MTWEETAKALLAADRAQQEAARKAREEAKRKAERDAKRGESKARKMATDSAYRQAWRDWAGARNPEEFDRAFRASLPTFRAPVSSIHPVKR